MRVAVPPSTDNSIRLARVAGDREASQRERALREGLQVPNDTPRHYRLDSLLARPDFFR